MSGHSPCRSGAGADQIVQPARTQTLADVLKTRDYRWNGEGTTSPRAWYIDVDEAAKDAEIEFLKTEIYRGEIDLLIRKIDAYDRLSERC